MSKRKIYLDPYIPETKENYWKRKEKNIRHRQIENQIIFA